MSFCSVTVSNIPFAKLSVVKLSRTRPIKTKLLQIIDPRKHLHVPKTIKLAGPIPQKAPRTTIFMTKIDPKIDTPFLASKWRVIFRPNPQAPKVTTLLLLLLIYLMHFMNFMYFINLTEIIVFYEWYWLQAFHWLHWLDPIDFINFKKMSYDLGARGVFWERRQTRHSHFFLYFFADFLICCCGPKRFISRNTSPEFHPNCKNSSKKHPFCKLLTIGNTSLYQKPSN